MRRAEPERRERLQLEGQLTLAEVRDLHFRAMGTDCHIKVVGAGDPRWGLEEVQRLEGLWTRFAPSEVTALTAQPRDVDPDTVELLRRAVQGFDLTGGLFNAFMIDQVEAAGYDRDFDEMSRPSRRGARPGRRPTVTIDGTRVSCSPPVDSGGLGKGLAADLVATRLVQRGADGALVNLGGDLRCTGEPPRESWQVGITVPIDLPTPLTVKLTEGAVCTSTPLLRRWTLITGEQAHHLIDPRTGIPLQTDLASVTVIAREAWIAEVLSKAVFLMPADDAVALLRAHEAVALLVTHDARVRQWG